MIWTIASFKRFRIRNTAWLYLAAVFALALLIAAVNFVTTFMAVKTLGLEAARELIYE